MVKLRQSSRSEMVGLVVTLEAVFHQFNMLLLTVHHGANLKSMNQLCSVLIMSVLCHRKKV